MTEHQTAASANGTVNFTPYSAIGTNLDDVRKRRREHDPTPLNLQVCWYVTPEIAAKLEAPEVLARSSVDAQPIYGRLLTFDRETLTQLREHLPDRIQSQIPATWHLPADLWGYAFFACPLPPVTTFSADQYARGDRMVLNGDGMLYRLGFEHGRAILKTRMMKTPCYYADLAAQLVPKFDKIGYRFLDGGMVRHSLLLGTRNQMNTAFLATKEHLLATFDAARPHIIDPDSLELLEPIGAASNWQGLAPKQPAWLTQVFQPYSNPAHPVCDHLQCADTSAGEFITANYSAGLSLLSAIDRFRRWYKGKLGRDGVILKNPWGAFTSIVRYRFDSQTFEKWRLVLPNGEPVIIQQAIHQMALTEDYIIVGDIAFKIELSQIFAPFLFGAIRKYSVKIGYWLSLTFLQLIQPIPYASLYIVKRADLDRPIPPGEMPTLTAVKIILPREVSHFVTDYRNPDGKITLMSAHNGGWDVTEWIGEYDESVNIDCEKTPVITKGIEMLAGVNNRLPSVPPQKCLRKEFRGFQPSPVDLNSVARYTIDAKTGAVLQAQFLSDIGDNPSKCNTWSVSVNTHRNLNRDSQLETGEKITSLYWMGWGFTWETIPKRIYRAYRDRDNRVISIEGLPQSDLPATLLRLDTERMEIADSFEFPIGYLARSPQFIPSQEPLPTGKDPATHGYIVCVIMSDAEPDNRHTIAKDEIWIFHADDFKGKPIYRLSHPDINLGLTIHSTWIPTIQFGKYAEAERQAMRKNTLDRDFNPVVRAKIFPHTKTLFRDVVYPHYIKQTTEAELIDLWK
ncbi:carotenoid oxygenase family protein [Chamaesiphon minutus]|uniref:Lignostilbene-alpha,beta-dioxygenase-like enzyme n=1 Tax=Chamaesiphon minutus (strain ATCC 27169 / PCC 6605) TaxID=1173020 RepID=K9UMG2_CHAP6|nr:carotenoid oxygenase family protein [Chamaesiphon minutus]AFY95833.1 lignostilbene-alpha,beta-dioxygenase-like enzyme [Chamaesiphon minutus PCC 6605]